MGDIKKIVVGLVIAGICTGSFAVVRTFTNEVRIESVKEIVIEIRSDVKKLAEQCK